MSYNLNILRSSKRLELYIPKINKIIDGTFAKIERKITLPEIDIVVADQPQNVIPEIGLGGYAPNEHVLYIYINPGHENLIDILELELARTLAHELHHCARFFNVGYNKNLLESIISEGLADHFDVEINDTEPTPWSIALKENDYEILLIKAKQSFKDEKYNYHAWFFGSEKEGIPRWTGYSLGYRIVGDYMKKTNRTASELVAVKAEEFI